jgi:hypothetical protein
MKKTSQAFLLYFFFSSIAFGACQNPAPRALPLVVPSGSSCPGSYTQTGTTCAPSSGAYYAFVVPSGNSCPGGYGQQGQLCIANIGSCYAYYSGGGSCPSGYSQQGAICISN